MTVQVSAQERRRLELLVGAAAVLVCTIALVAARPVAAPTELRESSDMREIDKMLNRIHKLTKHDFNGNREPAAAHTRLASVSEKTEKQQHKAAHVAVAVPKKEHLSPPEHEKPKVHQEVVVPAAAHGDHDAKKAKAHHRKRMALHRLAHKAQVQHASHKHVNKALEEAMQAEKAAMHSGLPKKKTSAKSVAKQKGIELKMKKLQAQISKDFSSVTKFGKKAGYLPPIKMPHM